MTQQIVRLVVEFRYYVVGILALIGLWYVRGLFHWGRRYAASAYGLERETASANRAIALSALLIVISCISALLIVTTPAALDVFNLADAFPTEFPTRVPTEEATRAAPELPGATEAPILETPTPVPSSTPVVDATAGCDSPKSTLTSPLAGAIVSGLVEVQGVAAIDNFAFYVLELSTLGENWLTVYTGNESTSEDGGPMGSWNADLQEPGNYAFRLTVYNSSGGAPEPCIIPITIGGQPSQ